MENKSDQQEQAEKRQRETVATESLQEEVFLVPGVPIVRSNTPRPLSFEYIVSQDKAGQQGQHQQFAFGEFPIEAPSAPPLPEECEDEECADNGKGTDATVKATPPPSPKVEPEPPQEFVWLFEYGLEMDTSVLNSGHYLNGLAWLYGPAVLKGYQLTFYRLEMFPHQVVATLVPSHAQEAEVWGVLYRVPRHLTEQLVAGEHVALDTLHLATSPNALYERCSVVAYDPYRKRNVNSMTYRISASAEQQFHVLPTDSPDPAYIHCLQEIANRHRLPQDYRKISGMLQSANTLLSSDTNIQKTELPPSVEAQPYTANVPSASSVPSTPSTLEKNERVVQSQRGLMLFATYVVLVFVAVLALGVVEGLGFGRTVFTLHFAPLGVPWFVLVYGLIGGCVSCIVRLARNPIQSLPPFILITWFTRPYFGIVLAMLMYLFLNTGLFALRGGNGVHALLFSLLGFAAGLCEGWLFHRILPLSFLNK